MYFYTKSRPQHPFHGPAKELGFNEFVKFFVENEKRDMRYFICSEDEKILVDHVARFENINKELEFLNLKISGIVEIQKLNSSNLKRTKLQLLYDSETQNLVAKRYAKDIALLGYKFE